MNDWDGCTIDDLERVLNNQVGIITWKKGIWNLPRWSNYHGSVTRLWALDTGIARIFNMQAMAPDQIAGLALNALSQPKKGDAVNQLY